MNLRRASGYTLLEVIVVLVLLAIAAGVVAPALLPQREEQPSLTGVIAQVREAAVRRGEPVRLRVDRSGAWQAVAGLSTEPVLLRSGRLRGAGEPLNLLFSSLGTCAPTPETVPARLPAGLDPLTCSMAPG